MTSGGHMSKHDLSKTPPVSPTSAKQPKPLLTPVRPPRITAKEAREFLSLAMTKLHECDAELKRSEEQRREALAENRDLRAKIAALEGR